MPKNSEQPIYTLSIEEIADLTKKPTQKISEFFDDTEMVRLPGNRLRVNPAGVRRYLSHLGHTYQPQVVAHLNLKGGVGKTTSAVCLATRAHQYGYKVCLLDLDSQASATLAFGVSPEEDDPIFYDVWQKPQEVLLDSLMELEPGLFLLPSSLENALLDFSLSNPRSQKIAVKGVCQELLDNGFDLVVIDCPPSLGTAVVSSICGSDTIVVPAGYDPFSFRGLDLTVQEIRSICETFGLQLPGIKVLYTRYDRREKAGIDAMNKLQKSYSGYFIDSPIRTSSEFTKALRRGETIFVSTRKSPAKDDYDAYTRHILNLNIKKKKRK